MKTQNVVMADLGIREIIKGELDENGTLLITVFMYKPISSITFTKIIARKPTTLVVG